MFIYPIYHHNWKILVLFVYITRLSSNKIFSPSNKIQWEVDLAKDLSAPWYYLPDVNISYYCDKVQLREHILLTLWGWN